MKSKNIGSTFDDWFREERLYEQTSTTAIERVLARQITQEMTDQNLSKSDMAKRMQTSRAALERLLDPDNSAVTLEHSFQSRNRHRSPSYPGTCVDSFVRKVYDPAHTRLAANETNATRRQADAAIFGFSL